MQKRLVRFKCCNTQRIFTLRGEFKMCECGKSGFDNGDGYYTRTLGKREDIEVTNLVDTDTTVG